MRNLKTFWAAAGAAVLVTGTMAVTSIAGADEPLPDEKQCSANQPGDLATQGWCAAITRRKGNCLACHGVTMTRAWPQGLPPGGNIAPPLVAMKERYPDRAKLRAKVWDATVDNPQVMMPPFGKHKLLSEQDIDAIVEWLYTI